MVATPGSGTVKVLPAHHSGALVVPPVSVIESPFVVAVALADKVMTVPLAEIVTSVPVAVALFEMVIVVPLAAVIVVPLGMPTPAMVCPTANPAIAATLVMLLLPLVVEPVL